LQGSPGFRLLAPNAFRRKGINCLDNQGAKVDNFVSPAECRANEVSLVIGFRSAFAGALMLLGACATVSEPSKPAPSAPPEQAAATPASGTWQGTTTSRGNEIRNITLRISQTGAEITGDYGCVAGNTACRNLNDSGTVSGKLTGNSFAVAIIMSPDNSRCYFTGTVVESVIHGGYQCLADGRFVELGSWRVKRLG